MALREVFIGPDDRETCPGCRDAMRGNPYALGKAPVPGTLGCGNNCRHMVQIQGEPGPGEEMPPTTSWEGTIDI